MAACTLVALLLPHVLHAQDIEPRRWTHLPNGMNLAGAGVVLTTGDLLFDPVLRAENVEMDITTVAVSYLRTFGLFGKSARIDAVVPLQSARWQGLVDSVLTTVHRDGMGDPGLRFSINLLGAPALRGAEYGQYRAARRTNTVVGAGASLQLPLGEYFEDKLLNLGGNRYVFRPELGAVHTRGPWSFELTGSVFVYTVNNEFWNGNRFEQDALWAVQAHVVRTFPHQLWASLSSAWGAGGRSQVNDVAKNDLKENAVFSASVGFPVHKTGSCKLAYWRTETQTFVGSNTHNILFSYAIRF